MGTQDSVEGWLRPGLAAALGAAGVLLPAGYISITCGAYQGSSPRMWCNSASSSRRVISLP